MSKKFFVVDTYIDTVVETHDSHTGAVAACRQANSNNDDNGRYDVQAAGEVEIVEICPSLGDCSGEEYLAACDRLERCYTLVESKTRYSVIVRPANSGEASGTYYRKPNGGLQILGYSLEMPEDLLELQEKAWNLFCSNEDV